MLIMASINELIGLWLLTLHLGCVTLRDTYYREEELDLKGWQKYFVISEDNEEWNMIVILVHDGGASDFFIKHFTYY